MTDSAGPDTAKSTSLLMSFLLTISATPRVIRGAVQARRLEIRGRTGCLSRVACYARIRRVSLRATFCRLAWTLCMCQPDFT